MTAALDMLKGIGFDGHSISVHRRVYPTEKGKKKNLGLSHRNGENSAPIFLTSTPKNFDAAQKEQVK